MKQLHEKCKECPHRDFCDEKRMAACAYLVNKPESALMPAAVPLNAELAQPLLVPHDYREINIGDGQTVSIDLEDIKQKLKEELHSPFKCNF